VVHALVTPEEKRMNRYSIIEAAKILGVTQQAIHGRISRDTIKHERGQDGKQYVYLTDGQLSDKRSQNPFETVTNDMYNSYITSLKS